MSCHRGERRLGGGDGFGRADMHPYAFEAEAEEPAVLTGTIEQPGQGKAPAGAPANSAGVRIAAPA